MTDEHTDEPEDESVSDGREFDIRPQGGDNIPAHAETDPADPSAELPSGWPELDSGLPEQLQVFVAQLFHQQIRTFPDADTAAELRDKAPEVYDAWIETTQSTIETDNYVRRAAADNPRQIATVGQVSGIIAVLGLFVLAGSQHF